MNFAFPYAFLFLIPLCFYFIADRRLRKKKPEIPFSSLGFFGDRPAVTWRTRTLFLPKLLFLLSLLLGIIALAGPQKITESVGRPKEGIAIELVLDRSSSMETVLLESLPPQKRIVSAKEAITSFVFGNEDAGLSGRPNDLIGLITFARYADTVYPLSVSHESLRPIVESIQTPLGSESEDGTNIGDALALAAARLKTAGERADYKAASRVVILLTDGENNVGEKTPEEAAALAKEWGIRIYCIFFGGRGYINYYGQRFPVLNNPAGFQELMRIAESTGGQSFRVRNAEELLSVYSEIDTLEKTPFEVSSLVNTEEKYRPFLTVSVLLLFLSVFLSLTVYRREE